jgi:calnexin
MQSDILFDNIYIGHSVEDAAALRAETYDLKRPVEDAEEAAAKPKPADKPKSPSELVFKDDPVTYVKEKFDLFLTIAKRDPIEAIKFVPEIAGGLGALAVALIAFVVGAISLSSSPATPSKEDIKKAAQKAKDSAAGAKDQAADSVSSGADAAKAEAIKRTTRSNAPAE